MAAARCWRASSRSGGGAAGDVADAGVAYAIIEEGLCCKSFFDPTGRTSACWAATGGGSG